MKKKNVMRMLSLVLVLTLISTCAISGTFAKYTTEDKASDFARVAKWGVELQVVGNLFGDSYKNVQVTNNDATVTVQSSNTTESADGDNVVAPGTENSTGFTFKLNGAPEVDSTTKFLISEQNIYLADNQYGMMIPVDSGVVTAANFSLLYSQLFTRSGTAVPYTYERCTSTSTFSDTATYYTLEDWVNVAADYYPVVYQLTGDTGATTLTYEDAAGYAVNTLAAIADKVATNVQASAVITESTDKAYKTYVAEFTANTNTDLAEQFKLSGENITWAWLFERGGNAVGDNASWQDKADTILGNMMFYAAGGSIEGDIVFAAASTTEGNTFTSVNYRDGAANIVDQGANIQAYKYVSSTATGNADIAVLNTQFSIDIIVTQVD